MNGDETAFGYELLFRDGVRDGFFAGDCDAASRSTLNTSLLMGLDILCDGKLAFINCTREVLLKDYITLLPPAQVAVEILESVEADDLVVAACVRLKKGGYLIALDDFMPGDPREALIPLADIIKVDLRLTTREQQRALVRQYGSRCRMTAEKVETRAEFLDARADGFHYFQGYFFQKPELMQVREIPANRLNYLRLLKMLSAPELDNREIEEVFKGEASLCYRFLRYLNSPLFSFVNQIHSVRHALSILGERELRRWIRLTATLDAGQNRPSDLVLSALTRARFGELLAGKLHLGGSDYFLLGLLSLMDAILQLPMGVVLDGIGLEQETKAVLLGTSAKTPAIYQLMLAQEKADWQQASALCVTLSLPEEVVADTYFDAMRWAREMTAGG
jgi:EAL and modified HD-GYP domain-containing signal transduction protein